MSIFNYPDMHVHTEFSKNDCKCPIDRYLLLLEDGIGKSIGFSDHLHPVTEWTSEQLNFPVNRFDDAGYDAAVRAAQARGLNVYKGIEVTYEERAKEYTVERISQSEYDYLIGATHSFDGFWMSRNYYQSVRPGGAFDWIVNRYHDAVLETVRVGLFDVLAHMGLYKRFLLPEQDLLVYAADLISEREDEVAKVCAQSGIIVEVNTSSLSNSGKTMPTDDFLRRFRHYGGERVALGSDAHDAKDLNQNFDFAADMLRTLGFRYLFYPWSQTPLAL